MTLDEDSYHMTIKNMMLDPGPPWKKKEHGSGGAQTSIGFGFRDPARPTRGGAMDLHGPRSESTRITRIYPGPVQDSKGYGLSLKLG